MAAWSAAAGGQSRPAPQRPDARALLARGRVLFAQGCASCHGEDLRGRPGQGPRCAAPARRRPTSTCAPGACRSPTRPTSPCARSPPTRAPTSTPSSPSSARRRAGDPARRPARAAASPAGWRGSPSTAPAATRSSPGAASSPAPPRRRCRRRRRPRSPRPCASGRTSCRTSASAQIDEATWTRRALRPRRAIPTTAAAGASATSGRSPRAWSRGSWPWPRCSRSPA